MKNIKKADLQDFLKKTERMLLDNHFRRTVVSDHAEPYEWIKETKYGTLLINPCNDYPDRVFSIFGRFKEPDKAKETLTLTGSNNYSGKCNFHTYEKDEILAQFSGFLALIS